MKWIEFPDERLELRGLYWFNEHSPALLRLPERARGDVRPEIWNLGEQPSGGRVRFATDSSSLTIRASYNHLFIPMENMCRIGQTGLACYIDDAFARVAHPAEKELEAQLFAGRRRETASVTVYLPLYHPVAKVAFGFDDDAEVGPAREFATRKPVAFYGSSITQGGCASQSGNSYQAMLGRGLNVDFVNLGFSGNGIGEPEVAKLFAEIDASCFVIDFAVNCASVEQLRDAYAPFLQTVRDAHSETPMICVTPIFATPEAWEADALGRLTGMRELIREAVAARVAAGDGHISLVEGFDMLGPADGDGLVDGVHPNDLGFSRMAAGLAGPVQSALGL